MDVARNAGTPRTPLSPLIPLSNDGRFVPGTLLVGRYRIVRLVGRGGMGEVYQADDLKLDQRVALKFLPDALALNAGALGRFHAEARVARQVSHPNVCRVYDIGDADGLHFLSMELIDGEDLASLLRRIGRLPGDKAVEIGRQICAGLAAAHDAGVLHRDLKPANVMIDGRGRARITDFGIAVIAREVHGGDIVAGTPAYMAPEQLAGQNATARSDIYSLGLVLYELFTGRHAIEAASVTEARVAHAGRTTPPTPSTWVQDLDPIAERAIMRCLEQDPARRPASAIQVAAALPGGDLMQAALAAGETPSPEMVAAAGTAGALRPSVALPILAAIITTLVVSAWLSDRTFMVGRLPMPLPPDVLVHKAREAFTRLGYTDAPGDSAYGFDYNFNYISYSRRDGLSEQRWQQLLKGRPSAVHFWYRESPESLQALFRGRAEGPPGLGPVELENPPATVRGMRRVTLDVQGRLVAFGAVPHAHNESIHETATAAWQTLFEAADLHVGTFTPVEPLWTPPVPFDTRGAWTGSFPEQPDLQVRLEAATYRGRMVAFETFGPWNPVPVAPAPRVGSRLPFPLPAIVLIAVSVTAAVLAWSNVRAGRGDRRGAFRLAVFMAASEILSWAFRIDHVAGPGEATMFRLGVSNAVLNAATTYMIYLALEPYVRRRWPQMLIGWSRILAGRWRDTFVGREILVGIGFAVATFLVIVTELWINSGGWQSKDLDAVLSVRRVTGLLIQQLTSAMAAALTVCFLLLVLRSLLRSTWLAGGVLVLAAMGVGVALSSPMPMGGAVMGGVAGLLTVIAITRFGLVAATALAFGGLLAVAPTTLDVSTWYAGVSLFTLGTIAAIAGYACWTAMGGRSV